MSEGEVHRLKQILGKYQQDVGILSWGTTTRKAQDIYRALMVDDNGKPMIKSIEEAITLVAGTQVDVTDREARILGIICGLYGLTPQPFAVDSSGILQVVTT
jgi:hypothetical protein